MSIVERALQKLQAGKAAARKPASAGDPGAAAGRPPTVTREPAHRPASSVAVPRPVDPALVVRIPFDALRADGVLPPEGQQRALADEYRMIKRPLIKNAFDPDLEAPGAGRTVTGSRSIMVSSAMAGDGKTFTSINLALSLALEKDHNVLLVDGDVAKPHVSDLFGVGDRPGLLDVLGDPSRPIHDVILATDMPRLSLLPVGKRSETATELLASARMRAVIEHLEEIDPEGIIVVDSPPILLTSEARVLASLFGQVVLVVRANGTPQQAVLEAIHVMGEGPRISLVLNQVAGGSSGQYYGYGYGYGYGLGSTGDGEAVQSQQPAPVTPNVRHG